eukprot:TRINITY_DN112142_c0_g1_i1.p1 TRINITY_DN112142_c0_g1~~TRINITY_DN112142_c0_g1_i1.p1  ORF type:complete len:180 (+),score=24.39 TRINITY_DN112142_c0_g1_i1:3-542(+)
MGFSMGGFTTANAFGSEHEVPAAWIDSAPFDPGQVFLARAENYLNRYGIGFMRYTLQKVWNDIYQYAKSKGILLDKHTPQDELPKGPDTKRPILVVASYTDLVVPFSQFHEYLTFLHSYPDKYETEVWETMTDCNNQLHCAAHLQFFDEYLRRLCLFWKKVFNASTEECKHLTKRSLRY